mgnify:CR=1 FL=1
MEVEVSIWWALVLAYYENMEILSRGLNSRKAYQGSYSVITEPSKTLHYWLCLAFGLLNGRAWTILSADQLAQHLQENDVVSSGGMSRFCGEIGEIEM